MKIKKKNLELLVNALCNCFAIMIFCNQDISRTVTTMSFKLGQVIEDNE